MFFMTVRPIEKKLAQATDEHKHEELEACKWMYNESDN
jgi:hypothetical protein